MADPFVQGLDEEAAARVRSWVEVRRDPGQECPPSERNVSHSPKRVPTLLPSSRTAQASKTPTSPFVGTAQPASQVRHRSSRRRRRLRTRWTTDSADAYTALPSGRLPLPARDFSLLPPRLHPQLSASRMPTAPPWSPSPYKVRVPTWRRAARLTALYSRAVRNWHAERPAARLSTGHVHAGGRAFGAAVAARREQHANRLLCPASNPACGLGGAICGPACCLGCGPGKHECRETGGCPDAAAACLGHWVAC
jgi:hypothetical protein